MTKAMDGEHLEDTLRARHQQRRPMASRPQPGRRGAIPKAEGTTRPLGLSGTADQIVQERTRRILAAIDEPGLCATAEGCRPGRSCHEALCRLNREGMSAPVHWIAALE